MRDLRIGDKTIGPGHSLYFIAEAGSNHDGDLAQAKRLVEVAKEAGADAVKFQTFRAEALYPRGAGVTDYLKIPRSIYDVIREMEMPLEWIPELAAYCQKVGIDFLSTPFDERSADALDPFVPAFKIASYEMTHHPLVQHVARRGKPLLVSTGTANLDEVRELVAAVRAVSDAPIALLQCTARYPAPLRALNVRALVTMAKEFGVPVGLSDHSREPEAGPMAAVALGASIIEKHFTLDNDLPGPDHAYALEPDELRHVIERVRQVELALGSGEKRAQPEEEELRRFARRSIFVTRRVTAGERLGTSNVATLRSGKLSPRLHPRDLPRLLGRKARRELAVDTAVALEDLDPLLLEHASVQLRPLEAGDAERVVRWRALPEVHAQLFSERPPSRAEHDAWFASLMVRSDRLELVILDDRRPVGTIGLSAIDWGRGEAEYGVLVGEPDARRKGVARRASELLLEWAFDCLGLTRVGLTLFADNAPARRLYDALGFTKADDRPPLVKDGVLRPVLAMTLDRETFARRRR